MIFKDDSFVLPCKSINFLITMKKLIICLFMLFAFQQMNAQINLKVGYSLAYTNPEIHNRIIESYNEQRPWLSQPMKETNNLNGFLFGIRYKMGRLAAELSWENQFDRFKASGEDPSNDSKVTESIYFKQAFYSFGLESFFTENLSIKASFDLNQIRYRAERTNVDGRFVLMKDWGYGSTFSIGYNFVGDRIMHVSIRPFMHISWTDFDISAFDEAINPDTTINTDPNDYQESFVSYGIKLVFYNGYWD